VSRSSPTVAQAASSSGQAPSRDIGPLCSGKFGSSSSQSSPDRLSRASWLPSRRFDLGDGGERLEEHAHRRVVQGETVEGDCADQGVGRDVPVGGIDGEQSGVRDFRGQEARRVALLSHRGNSNEQGLMPKSPTAERRT
jgi:hypothetical protein